MTTLSIGNAVPDFELPATGEQRFSLAGLRGKHVVLYFYPKDSTPGCTTEGQEFGDLYGQFQRLGAEVLGISRDSLRSHENFKTKQNFPFNLLSDSEETACVLFDVIREKTMYGRKVRGIERSTFLVDDTGVLRREWRKVKVAGHAAEVLAAVRELHSQSEKA